MDITTTTFAVYGQILPILASVGAGLATFALLSGTARIIREKDSQLPSDPEVAQAKYALAFDQLNTGAEVPDPPEAGATGQGSAIYLALGAFEQYQTATQAVKKDKK
jgi:hypothetical protein